MEWLNHLFIIPLSLNKQCFLTLGIRRPAECRVGRAILARHISLCVSFLLRTLPRGLRSAEVEGDGGKVCTTGILHELEAARAAQS